MRRTPSDVVARQARKVHLYLRIPVKRKRSVLPVLPIGMKVDLLISDKKLPSGFAKDLRKEGG